LAQAGSGLYRIAPSFIIDHVFGQDDRRKRIQPDQICELCMVASSPDVPIPALLTKPSTTLKPANQGKLKATNAESSVPVDTTADCSPIALSRDPLPEQWQSEGLG